MKDCTLKGKQKLFFLQLDQAASCCRADPISLQGQTLDSCLDLWQAESQQLSQGTELSGCRHCWQAEHSGQQSYRQQLAGIDSNYVEIYASNLCNQTCSYCSPKFSSAWNDNIVQHGNFVKVSKSAVENLTPVDIRTDHSQWYDDLKKYLGRGPVSLKLLGGEPLMQRRNLQQLLEFNTDQITTLNINTNLNPPSNKFLKWVLENFPKDKLQFEISLDTVPLHNALPRAGFDQSKFEENLELLKQYQIPFLFLSVVSVLNIFSIAEYQNWLIENAYQCRFFRINNPDCLDPSYLPTEFKQTISDKIPSVATQALKYNPDKVDLKRFEQYNYLTQYFQRTNNVITDPNFNNYWNWLKDKYENRNSK